MAEHSSRVGRLLERRAYLDRVYHKSREQSEWSEYDSPYPEYNTVFRELLPGGFVKHLRERKKMNKPCHVLDAMASTGFLRSLATEDCLDSGLAVTLHDHRNEAEQANDAKQQIELVAGDIVRKNTWKKIDQWQQAHALTVGFDVVVSRGIHGLTTIRADKAIGAYLLNELWKRVSLDEGMLIVEVPRIAMEQLVDYEEFLYNLTTISFRYRLSSSDQCPIIQMMKFPNAPATLPTPPWLEQGQH